MTDWSSQDSFITPGNQFYRIYFNSSKIQSLFHILQKRNCSVCLTTFSYYYAEKYYGKHRCMVLAFSWEFSNVQELDYLELQQEWSSSWESLCNSLVKRQVSKKYFLKYFFSVWNDSRTPFCKGFQAQTLLHASFHSIHPDLLYTGWQSLGPRKACTPTYIPKTFHQMVSWVIIKLWHAHFKSL